MTTLMTGTLKIEGEELAIELAPKNTSNYVHTYIITVRHPEGGVATWTVQNWRGFYAHGDEGNDSPINVHQAVLAVVKRMDAAWSGAHSGAPFAVGKAFLDALSA